MVNNKIKIKFQEGFTGADILLAMIISSALMVGMAQVYIDVAEKLRVEKIRSDVIQYGNLILDDIEKSMVSARNIVSENFANYSSIECQIDDQENINYSVNAVNGILKNGVPFDDLPGTLTPFNNVSSGEKGGHTSFRIFEFDCEPMGITEQNTNQNLAQSIYDLRMSIDIYNTRDSIIDEVFFNRKILFFNS